MHTTHSSSHFGGGLHTLPDHTPWDQASPQDQAPPWTPQDQTPTSLGPDPPMDRNLDTCYWKYYLAQTSFAGSNNIKLISK